VFGGPEVERDGCEFVDDWHSQTIFGEVYRLDVTAAGIASFNLNLAELSCGVNWSLSTVSSPQAGHMSRPHDHSVEHTEQTRNVLRAPVFTDPAPSSGVFNYETHEQCDFDHRRWQRNRLRTYQTTHGIW